MRCLLLALLLLSSGCTLAKERVGDYVTEAALESVQRKVDGELAKRDLSLAKLQAVADLNKDGKTTAAEALEAAKRTVLDVATARIDAAHAEKSAKFEEATRRLTDRLTLEGRERRAEEKAELEKELARLRHEGEHDRATLLEKIKAGTVTPGDLTKYEEGLAAVKKQEEVLERHGSLAQDFKEWFSYLVGTFVLAVLGYFAKQWRGAGKHSETNARIMVLEKLLGRDLDMNGVVGEPSRAPQPPRQAG